MYTSISRTVISAVSIFCLSVPMWAEEESPKEEPFSIGVLFGPCIPSESIEQVYNSIDNSGIGTAYESASSLGYHLGAKMRFGLSDVLSFSGGVNFTQFPGQSQTATLSNGSRITIQTVTTFVPVYAGITFIPIKGLVRPYLAAEAMYSYRNVTISSGNTIFQDLISGTGQDLEPQTSRIGAAATAGVEFNLGGLRPFFELKYNLTNLVGKEAGEETMAFLNVSLGLVF